MNENDPHYFQIQNTDSFPDLVTGGGSLKSSEYVRDLGVIIGKNPTFEQHIKTYVNLHLLEFSKFGKLGHY